MRYKIPILLFFALNLFIADGFGDSIKLKNGREIWGKLKEVSEKGVALEIEMGGGSGEIWFLKDKVESINNLSFEEAKARLSTTDALISDDQKEILTASAQEGLTFVAKTRKLEFKNTPEIEVVNRKKTKEYLKNNMKKHYSEDKLETRRKLLVKLGIISKDEKYSEEVSDLLLQEIAGYYDPETKKIYVNEKTVGNIVPGLPSITVMHEQVHALQDQYYDLKKILEEPMLLDNEDKVLAIRSIVEGEATVLMYDASFRSLRGFGAPDFSKKGFDLRSFVIDSMLAYSKRFKTEDGAPGIFMEDMLFPYVWGGSFVQHIVNTKGWEAVDTIYSDMPVSTEQIMHPEKYYIARDNPTEVRVPDASSILGASWIRLHSGIFGEFSFYLVGKAFLDELSTKLMSEGWSADRYDFYENTESGQTLLLLISKWDSQKDADEFFTFYKKVIEKKYQSESLVKEDENFLQWKTEDENVYIGKFHDSIILIEGAPEVATGNLIEAFQGSL